MVTAWTAGHSTHRADEFVALLRSHEVQAVADVRRFPGSRRHPHFAREALERLLAEHGIGYHGMPELGGRRTPREDSPNTGWRVAAFRGYADYMDTADFAAAFDALRQLAAGTRVAIMCAEALWWQCHRRLIADALVARGDRVVHIGSSGAAEEHRLIAPATLRAGRLSYAAAQPGLEL